MPVSVLTPQFIFDYLFAIVEHRALDSQSNIVDFRLVSRMTSSNSIVASKPATLKSAVAKPAAPKPVPKLAAPKSTASEPARKLAAPKSATSEPARKQAAPKSASEPACKQAAPKSASEPARKQAAPKSAVPGPKPAAKELPVGNGRRITREVHNEDQASDIEPAVGGLLDEDDSLEREVAMSSPLKGAELRAAKQVCYIFIINHWTQALSVDYPGSG